MKISILSSLIIFLTMQMGLGQKITYYTPIGTPINDIKNYSYNTKDGYQISCSDGLYSVLDASGKILIDKSPDAIEYLGFGFFYQTTPNGNFLYKENSKIIQESVDIDKTGFIGDLLKIHSNGNAYMINSAGTMSKGYTAIFNEYPAIRAFRVRESPNQYGFKNDWYIVDAKTFSEILVPYDLDDFSEGVAEITDGNANGFIDYTGSILAPLDKKRKGSWGFYNGLTEAKDKKGNERCWDKFGKQSEDRSCLGNIVYNVNGLLILNKDYPDERHLVTPYIKQEVLKFGPGKKLDEYRGYKQMGEFLMFQEISYGEGSFTLINPLGKVIAQGISNPESIINISSGLISINSFQDMEKKWKKGIMNRDGEIVLNVPDSLVCQAGTIITCKPKEKKVEEVKTVPVYTQTVQTVPNLYYVAFVKQKYSQGLMTASTSYACVYVEVGGTTDPETAINTAKQAGYDYDSNGYNTIKIITGPNLDDLKKIVNAGYVLSDFIVQYTKVK